MSDSLSIFGELFDIHALSFRSAPDDSGTASEAIIFTAARGDGKTIIWTLADCFIARSRSTAMLAEPSLNGSPSSSLLIALSRSTATLAEADMRADAVRQSGECSPFTAECSPYTAEIATRAEDIVARWSRLELESEFCFVVHVAF